MEVCCLFGEKSVCNLKKGLYGQSQSDTTQVPDTR